MAEHIKSFLQNQGLNKKDVQIYLDIYRHGQSFASSVALRTKIDRTTVYAVLKRLVRRGVLTAMIINDVNTYVAVSPEVFVQSIDNQVEELLAKKKVANFFVEEMQNLGKQTFVKPKIRIYEGSEAIIGLYEETLRNGKEQKGFISLQSLPCDVKDFLMGRFIQSKLRKGVFSKVIVSNNKYSKRYKKLDGISNRETRVVEKTPFDLYAEIVLFGGNSVAIIDFHQQIYGIVIESQTLYKTIEALFDYVWGEK